MFSDAGLTVAKETLCGGELGTKEIYKLKFMI